MYMYLYAICAKKYTIASRVYTGIETQVCIRYTWYGIPLMKICHNGQTFGKCPLCQYSRLSLLKDVHYTRFHCSSVMITSSMFCADDSAGSKATDEAWSNKEVQFY